MGCADETGGLILEIYFIKFLDSYSMLGKFIL